MSQLDKLNTKESINQTDKSSKFLENSRKTVRDVLTKTGIVINTILPTTATTTPTIIPTSINTLTPIASTTIKAIGLGTATSLFTACGGGEDSPDGPVNPIDTKDTIAPTIEINKNEIDITGGKEIKISGNQLYIGDILVASRSDNKSKNCKVELSLNGKSITSGTTISEEGTLTIKISDEAGNTKNANIKLNITAEQNISGLENIKNLDMQVDQEINILNGITFGNGADLIKTEIELEGEKTEISEPQHYTPEYPGECSIILSIKCKNGEINEYKVDNLTIKPLEYKAIEISNINPETLMPKIEGGDKNVYKYIEHLRIPESTVIRDMMRKYGAGNHSAEEYQQLMSRLNTGMMGENPIGYDNYEIIGEDIGAPSQHAHGERYILNTLINHANFVIINPLHEEAYDLLHNLCKKDPNKINIIGISMGADVNKEQYNAREIDKLKQYDKEKNLLIFEAGGNIHEENGNLLNKVYQENLSLPDEHSVYGSLSRAHNKNDNILNRHIVVTFATNKTGDIDQTNESAESSKFPVGFHNKILFSGRTFPQHYYADNEVRAVYGKYATSQSNYLNVAVADILFQMKADAPDIDEFLEMVRSTCLTDYIRFDLNKDGDTNDTYNGQQETQPLQLMNPAGFFQKYLMPNNLPNNLKSDKIISLDKGYYKGVIFDIPGAEVNINGERIPYNNENKSKIKNTNPMDLEWRLNGNLCRKMGYKGKNLEGKIIVVDDKWNGLNIDKKISTNIQ